MNKFPEIYIFPRLNHEENRQITSREIESIIKTLPKNKSPRPDSFAHEFNQKVKNLMFILLKLFQKLKMREIIQPLFTRPA